MAVTKVVEVRGKASLRNLPFTGISGMCADEKTAREEAMRNALTQISLFDGVSVNYTYLSQTIEENGTVNEKSESDVSMLSKSLNQALEFNYYSEQSKGPQGLKWQAWCHIPYSDTVRQKFLDELIRLTSNSIEPVESQISEADSTNPIDYIDNLDRVWKFYSTNQVASKNWFTAPNNYTAFLERKCNEASQQVEGFYQHLVFQSNMKGANSVRLQCLYKGNPYSGNLVVNEHNAVAMIDTLMVTKDGDGFLVAFFPKHTGETTIRVNVDQDRFPNVECSRDVPLTLELKHLFTGKTVGLYCRDSCNKCPEAEAAFSDLITGVEGKVVELSFLDMDKTLEQGISYFLIIEPRITEVRENHQQGLFIAFPALSMKIIELATRKIIYEVGFPNSSISDIRGLGKTRETAISNAYSFGEVLTNKDFIRSFRELKK